MAPSQPDSSRDTPDIEPGRLYSAVLARWPLILAAGLAGALFGIAIAAIVPAKYEAVAELSVGIDYNRVEFLDEDAERHILRRVQDLLLSDQVMAGAMQSLPPGIAAESGILGPGDLRQRVRLTQIEARWSLAVTDSDADRAAVLANAWAQSALQSLEESQQHAWRAAELQAAFFEIACRPREDGLWVCDEIAPGSPASGLQQELLDEIQASNGIAPVVSFALLSGATAPAQPVTSGRAALATAGTVLGLLIGFGLATLVFNREMRPPETRKYGAGEPLGTASESEGH